MFEGEETDKLKDRRGFETVAELLGRPHTPIPALTLMLPGGLRAAEPADWRSEGLRADEISLGVVDAKAIGASRSRLAEIDSQLLLSTEGGAAYERLQEDRKALSSYLRSVSNHRGEPRPLVDARERARGAVTKRIRDAIAAIGPQLPALAAHLRLSIRTGSQPVYRPLNDVPWMLE